MTDPRPPFLQDHAWSCPARTFGTCTCTLDTHDQRPLVRGLDYDRWQQTRDAVGDPDE